MTGKRNDWPYPGWLWALVALMFAGFAVLGSTIAAFCLGVLAVLAVIRWGPQ